MAPHHVCQTGVFCRTVQGFEDDVVAELDHTVIIIADIDDGGVMVPCGQQLLRDPWDNFHDFVFLRAGDIMDSYRSVRDHRY